MVEVFDPASTRGYFVVKSKSKLYYDRRSAGQSESWVICYYMCDSYGLVLVGRPLWREVGSILCICCWPLPAQSFSDPSPLGLETIFYSLTFETSLFVASYGSQGHGGGIRPRLHTGVPASLSSLSLYNSSARTLRKTPCLHLRCLAMHILILSRAYLLRECA
jgi:hypothetical protein